MGKVNVCLKRSYIVAASLIGIISALLLAATLFSHGYVHENEEIEKMLVVLQAMYIFSIVTLILAIVGVFGACKEKKWALILFAVGMILGSLFMFGYEINFLAARPKIIKQLKKDFLDPLPLTNASENFLNFLKATQLQIQCCGMDQGHLDWGYNIPVSCICTEEPINPCVAAPRNSSLFEHSDSDQPIMIYKEPCLQHLIEQVMTIFGIKLGIMLGVTLLWVLSVVLCIIILCQLSQKIDTPTVVYSQEAKAGNYCVLAETAELT